MNNIFIRGLVQLAAVAIFAAITYYLIFVVLAGG